MCDQRPGARTRINLTAGSQQRLSNPLPELYRGTGPVDNVCGSRILPDFVAECPDNDLDYENQ